MTNKEFVLGIYPRSECLGIMDIGSEQGEYILRGYIIHNGLYHPDYEELSERWAKSPKAAWKSAREKLDQKLLDMAEQKEKTWD